MKKTLSIFTRPVPMWLFALWIAGGMSVAALAAVPLYTGSLSVPATGTNTENQLSASQCIGTDASKVEKSNSNCVQSLTGTANRVTVSGATGAITLNGPQDLATTSSPTFATVTTTGSTALTDTNTGAVISLGTANTQNTSGVQIANALGGSHITTIAPNSGSTVQTITGAALRVDAAGVATLMTLDGSGNMGIAGTLHAVGLSSGTGTVQCASDGATTSYCGPAYTTAGAAVASTWHSVKGTCTAAASTSCAVTFTGAAVFASASSYACEASNADNVSTTTFKTFANASGSGTTLFFTAADSSTWSFVCSGT